MSAKLRWRKFSPIDRDWPIFELIDRDVVLLDVTKGDDLSLKVAFHGGASGRELDLVTLESLLEQVKVLLANETAV
jgi:hypothetical protein